MQECRAEQIAGAVAAHRFPTSALKAPDRLLQHCASQGSQEIQPLQFARQLEASPNVLKDDLAAALGALRHGIASRRLLGLPVQQLKHPPAGSHCLHRVPYCM